MEALLWQIIVFPTLNEPILLMELILIDVILIFTRLIPFRLRVPMSSELFLRLIDKIGITNQVFIKVGRWPVNRVTDHGLPAD